MAQEFRQIPTWRLIELMKPKPDAALFITGWWPSRTDPHNGVFVREHALAVQSKQQVVVVHLTVSKRSWSIPKVEWREEVHQGLVVVYGEICTPVRRGGLLDLLVRNAYRMALRRLSLRYRFQCLHIHVRTPITEIAPAVGEEFDLPTIVTEHSSFYHIWIDDLPPAERDRTVTRLKLWFAQPSVRAVLPVSHDLGRVLQNRFGVPKEKIQVVANVASPLFHPSPVTEIPPFRIVLAARWSVPKDPALFIAALRQLPVEALRELSIDWVGDGELLEEVMASSKDLVEQGILRFRGRLEKKALAALLANAHLLAHPTKAENLPCIIIESLCCGTPVLSMAVNGIPEMVNDSNGLLCPSDDPKAFATALLRIKDTYGSYSRARIADAAYERYSQERIAAQFLQIYHQVQNR